jgi:hypothetical protein
MDRQADNSSPARVVVMAGGYVHCGGFRGSDKSGSAISGLIDALSEFVPTTDRPSFLIAVTAPLREALDSCQEYILIDANIAELLIPALESFNTRVGHELGFPEPWDAPAKDEEAGLDSIEAKWGKGKGWQYYCAHDLLQACRVSAESREPICVSFD